MREVNITNDVIDFLKIELSKNTPAEKILRGMSLKGWEGSCNDWEGFVALLNEGNLDKIFLEYEFYIRY